MEAVKLMAKEMKVPKGIVVERALVAYLEGMTNGVSALALKTVADVRHHAEARGYIPRHGGAEFAALIERWGPASYTPRSGFRWESGAFATRETPNGPAYHCLWCDSYGVTGGPIDHKPDCPTISG